MTKAVDLSHHLSLQARARIPIPTEYDSFERGKDLISLDGGQPAPNYYPYETITSQYLRPDAFPLNPSISQTPPGLFDWLANLFGSAKPPTPLTDTFKISRYAEHDGEFEVSTLLNYSPDVGLEPFRKFVREFAEHVFAPGYSDWNTFVTVGAGDGFALVLEVLANRGDGYLVDEWTYSGTLEESQPLGVVPVPVKVDGVGLVPSDLEHILSTWDEEARGFKRPRVLYQVPVGHNPLGTTLTAARKQEIYAIAVKWDIVIVEDDPYYFHQSGKYVRENVRSKQEKSDAALSDQEWLDSLVPSFLRYDYEGRVIRIDTFSKNIGPGGRLGFITTSPILLKHIQYTQGAWSRAPSGISQALVGTLLKSWGQNGYIRWLRGLCGQYKLRRDITLDLLYKNFDFVEENRLDHTVLVGYAKRSEKKRLNEKGTKQLSLFEFVPSTGGMFMWFKFHLHNHPSFSHLVQTTSLSSARNTLNYALWTQLAEGGVLLRPGPRFQARSDKELDDLGETDGYARLSYSPVERDTLERALAIFGKVLTDFFH